MGETSNEIERHIQATREDLSDNFLELEDKVKAAVDWRAQFEARPGTLMTLAFGGGILLSALLPSRRASRRRFSDSSLLVTPDRSVSARAHNTNRIIVDGANETGETWNAVKGALLGVATTKLSGFIEELIPGFQQEFTKGRDGKSAERSSKI